MHLESIRTIRENTVRAARIMPLLVTQREYSIAGVRIPIPRKMKNREDIVFPAILFPYRILKVSIL